MTGERNGNVDTVEDAKTNPSAAIEDSIPSAAEIQRLGRQRPDTFRTALAEVAFCFSLLASMFMAVSECPANIRKGRC